MPLGEGAKELVRAGTRTQAGPEAGQALSACNDEQWEGRERPTEYADGDSAVGAARNDGQDGTSKRKRG